MNHVFPFRVIDTPLSQYNIWYDYMFISISDLDCVYIGATGLVFRRLKQHNFGYGSQSIEPIDM